MLAGTTETVSSHPKAPGARPGVTLRSPAKLSNQPLAVAPGFSRTPKYTRPSGATIGEAVPSAGSNASSPLVGSFNGRTAVVASVALFSASKLPRPEATLLTAT